MARLIISVLVGFSFLFNSCSTKKTSGSENEDFPPSYSKNIGKFSFKLVPFKSDKLVSIYYGNDINKISQAEKDSITKEYENFMCFVLEITIDGFSGDIVDFEEQNTEPDYNKRLNYYLSEMQKDLVLKDSKGNQTPCNIYYFQRLSELAKTNKFIVGFNKPVDKDLTFQYRNPLLKCGTINFSFNTNNI